LKRASTIPAATVFIALNSLLTGSRGATANTDFQRWHQCLKIKPDTALLPATLPIDPKQKPSPVREGFPTTKE
jgi:hypothetical protein